MVGCRSCAVIVVSTAPEAFDGLPPPFAVRASNPVSDQVRAAVLGAAIAVSCFTAFFLTLAVLYIWRCEILLHSLHGLWIGSLIGGPLALLIYRICEANGAPLDVLTLGLSVWKCARPPLATPADTMHFA